jgi:hypothetical protein
MALHGANASMNCLEAQVSPCDDEPTGVHIIMEMITILIWEVTATHWDGTRVAYRRYVRW